MARIKKPTVAAIKELSVKEEKNTDKVTLQFCGGAKVVTGANYLLQAKGYKILIDCGRIQGSPEMEQMNNNPFSYNPSEIDFLFITHGHYDHIGRIPKLVEAGFKGKILTMPPTIDIARLILEDAQRIIAEEEHREKLPGAVNYHLIDQVMALFEPVEYDTKLEIDKDIVCFFRNAGHILGSAIVEIWVRKIPRQSEFLKIVFSGDLGNSNIPFPLLEKPAVIEYADYIIMESAYGDRNHVAPEKAKDLLEDAIENAIRREGVLMMPTSALEKTQQVLYHLNELAKNKRIPYVPIYVDSPLAIKLTGLFKKYSTFLNKDAQKVILESDGGIFQFPGLSYTASVNESKMINRVLAPKIIIAGSSMSQGGRIMHHELRYLSDAKSTFLAVAYQAEGTLGRKIIEGAREVTIYGQHVPINAEVKFIDGYSAHADQSELLRWVGNLIKPIDVKKIFIVQGEEQAATALKHAIRDNFGISTEVPENNEIVELY